MGPIARPVRTMPCAAGRAQGPPHPAPSLPAQQAGITEGDLILEVEGTRVAGSRARDLQPYLERKAGQPLRFLLRKPNGEERQVTVIPGPKP